MARVQWPLLHGRPMIQLDLTPMSGGQALTRTLLADTGAGTMQAAFELLLAEQDCLACGGIALPDVVLGGAYAGSFPAYLLQVRIPKLGFDKTVPFVGIPTVPAGFEGIACFRFLNRFSYGNFANSTAFVLET
jgi:hypothetical protein